MCGVGTVHDEGAILEAIIWYVHLHHCTNLGDVKTSQPTGVIMTFLRLTDPPKDNVTSSSGACTCVSVVRGPLRVSYVKNVSRNVLRLRHRDGSGVTLSSPIYASG